MKYIFFSFCLVCAFSASTSIATEDTPVTHDEILGASNPFGTREWRNPDFDGQGSFVGFSPDAFKVPKGMEERVEFWKKVYTEYTSNQGMIHNAENLGEIYKKVDFEDIINNPLLTRRQIEKEKQNRVDSLKKVVLLEKPNLKMEDLRFQLGQKDRIETAIFLSGRYIEDFEDIFRQNQLPIQLTRLVFVESSFNVLARSKVGASGLWQIMPSNARPHRMITPLVDKRNHPIEATKLAAKILRNNYGMLENWPLAVTGYNHGPTGVMKMTKKYNTRDLAELIENVNSRKSFGFASRNFYASFLAILDVESNAPKYFKNIRWSKRIPGEPLKMKHALPFEMLSRWFDNDLLKLQIFNPHLNRKLINSSNSVPNGTWLLIPEKSYLNALSDMARIKRRIASNDKN
jgi:membrane-bound lytic murein transglycosylase D